MKRFILSFMIIMILACAAMPSFADSKSYIGSCANSFYTTSKITIVKDDYFEDVNIYAKLGSTSGPGTSYYSNLVLFNNQACTSINNHHQIMQASGQTHWWDTNINPDNTTTYYLKLQVKNVNTGYTTYVAGTFTSTDTDVLQ